ncbi:MAG: hypothetical protein LBD46_08520 [Endomicrobium sp.]|jgi:hypothetical protein|nr:hypothetical protein [Endomicrobium sp.]
MDRDKIVKRYNALMAVRDKKIPKWKKLTEFILPEYGFYPGQDWDAEPDYSKIIDNAATEAAAIVADGLYSGITPPDRAWFKLTHKSRPDLDTNHYVQLWLNDCVQRILKVLTSSNAYDGLYHIYNECPTFGNSAVAVLEDINDVVNLQAYMVGEYSLAIDSKGNINSLARCFEFTVEQIVSEFGLNNVSQEIQWQYTNNDLDKRHTIYNIIQPNYEKIEGVYDRRGKPYLSYYWLSGKNIDNEGFLAIRGFREFPVMTPRWKKLTTRHIYAVGNGHKTLNYVKSLQRLQKDSHIGVEKGVNPPVQINSSSRLSGINVMPGGQSYVPFAGSAGGIKTVYDVNLNVESVEYKIASTRDLIHKSYRSNLFLMIAGAGKDMTAREVAALKGEQLLQLGPLLQNLTRECPRFLINRVFNLMLEGGLFAPVPRELEGVELDIEYLGLLAQAQKIAELNILGQATSFAGGVIGINPEISNIVNWEETVRKYYDMAGAMPELLNSREEVAAMNKAKARAAQQQQEIALLGGAIDKAKTLSDTDTSKPNALTDIVGVSPNRAAAQ